MRERWQRPLPHGHVQMRGATGPLDAYDETWEDGRPVRVLATGDTLQSAVYLDERPNDPVFEYYVLYDLMFEGTREVSRALMLGGGAFAYPRYCLAAHPAVRMDVVEVDRAAIRLARRRFGLGALERTYGRPPRGRLGVWHDDARTFLAERRGVARYDAILNDCFSGHTPAASLATVEAARLVHDRLERDGLFLSNVVAALEGPRALLLHEVARAYAEAFAHVCVVPALRNPAAEDDNNLFVASDAPFDFPGAHELSWPDDTPLLTDANVQGHAPWCLR